MESRRLATSIPSERRRNNYTELSSTSNKHSIRTEKKQLYRALVDQQQVFHQNGKETTIKSSRRLATSNLFHQNGEETTVQSSRRLATSIPPGRRRNNYTELLSTSNKYSIRTEKTEQLYRALVDQQQVFPENGGETPMWL